MNKIIITLISIFTVGLLISSVTAVPNTHSETMINKIDSIEKFTTIISNLKEKIKNIQSSLNTKDPGQILAIIVIIVVAAAIVLTAPIWWWPVIGFLILFFIFLIFRSIIQSIFI